MKIELRKLEKTYQEIPAVKSIDLSIPSGHLHFLLGPSGCGKTTTLRMIAGLEKPTSGQIFFDGEDVTHLSPSSRGIGMVFQNYALWPHMTVWKNIEYGLKLKKFSKKEIRERVLETLSLVHLEQYSDRYPAQLSGGQQQRVALARALAIQPRALLLDEPLSNLDASLRHDMRESILEIHQRTGITTVFVTHDQREAMSMGTSVSVLRSGHLLQSDSPRNLYKKPNSSFLAGFVGETNLLPATVKEVTPEHTTLNSPIGTLLSSQIGHTVAPGDDVTVSIRPEAASFQAMNSPLENRIELTLKHITFLGSQEQLDCTTVPGQAFRIQTPLQQNSNWIKGSSLHCSVHPSDVVVLPYNEAMA
ncbi:MAG: ABC transporter ATP-binding protein [Oligoflexales bacterium]